MEPTSTSRKARIAAFVKKLSRIKRANTAAPLVAAEIASLRRFYADATLPATFSLYRSAIRAAYPDHPAADMFLSAPAAAAIGVKPEHQLGFSSAEVKERKRETRYRVARQQHKQIAITEPLQFVRIAKGLITNPGRFAAGPNAGKLNWYALLVGLALLTGRRPVEIALLGDLRTIRRKNPPKGNWAVFSGQAKTRDAEGTAQDAYEIPLLADTKLILNAWKVLKHVIPPAICTPEAYANTGAKGAFEVVTKNFPPGTKLYDLRAIYAALTWPRFAPPECSMPAWAGTVLGHKLLTPDEGPAPRGAALADTATAAFYLRYFLPPAIMEKWRKAKID